MSLVRLKYGKEGSNRKPMQAALRLSDQLKTDYNLVRGKDYSWHFSTAEQELHLLFHGLEAEQVSTVVAMQYMGRNLSEI